MNSTKKMVVFWNFDENHLYRAKSKSKQNPRHAVAEYPNPMATPWENQNPRHAVAAYTNLMATPWETVGA